ncbi:MAG: GNAT family acetyltransferase [Candidatus Cloacimonetes bacterium HGW-Cloacimonetes-1]|jgi:spermidine synthase|nr:MAG: GNAT family acetyltransferase [Candidatus Cloacimonetes bacterium HGW-Cloacimonetes-1]
MINDVELKIVKSADTAQLLSLYRHAGWWDTAESPRHTEVIAAIVTNSFCFVTASIGDSLIGMGRSISDGVSDAYIQDVMVHTDYRGNGIGKDIIRTMVAFLKEHELQWIGLISEPGYERFYQSLGFDTMPGYTPFLLKQ